MRLTSVGSCWPLLATCWAAAAAPRRRPRPPPGWETSSGPRRSWARHLDDTCTSHCVSMCERVHASMLRQRPSPLCDTMQCMMTHVCSDLRLLDDGRAGSLTSRARASTPAISHTDSCREGRRGLCRCVFWSGRACAAAGPLPARVPLVVVAVCSPQKTAGAATWSPGSFTAGFLT